MKNNKPPSKASSRKQFYFLTLAHTVLDSYATLLSHLQPLLLTKLASAATRNSLAGNFISIYSVFSSLGQIFFGWLSDRVRTVHFVTFGVALTAIGLSLLWVAPSPLTSCICYVSYRRYRYRLLSTHRQRLMRVHLAAKWKGYGDIRFPHGW